MKHMKYKKVSLSCLIIQTPELRFTVSQKLPINDHNHDYHAHVNTLKLTRSSGIKNNGRENAVAPQHQ